MHSLQKTKPPISIMTRTSRPLLRHERQRTTAAGGSASFAASRPRRTEARRASILLRSPMRFGRIAHRAGHVGRVVAGTCSRSFAIGASRPVAMVFANPADAVTGRAAGVDAKIAGARFFAWGRRLFDHRRFIARRLWESPQTSLHTSDYVWASTATRELIHGPRAIWKTISSQQEGSSRALCFHH